MGSLPNLITASPGIHGYTEVREQSDVIFQRSRFSFLIRIKKVAAIVVVLTFVFWLGFSVARHNAPRASYPYYDIQKPVPPWTEPRPLEGNYDRRQGHK